MGRPKKGDRVQTRFGKGTISDDYWADRDRYTVKYDDGAEGDHGAAYITILTAQSDGHVKASESVQQAHERYAEQSWKERYLDARKQPDDLNGRFASVGYAITQAEARGREQMADAVRKAMQDGYPEPPTKGDQCEHGKFGWEDCIACYDTALDAAITALIPGEPA